MIENKLIKEIHELIKDIPQDKVNAVILYQLLFTQGVCRATFESQKLIHLAGERVDIANIYSSKEHELMSSFNIDSIKNLIDNMG